MTPSRHFPALSWTASEAGGRGLTKMHNLRESGGYFPVSGRGYR